MRFTLHVFFIKNKDTSGKKLHLNSESDFKNETPSGDWQYDYK